MKTTKRKFNEIGTAARSGATRAAEIVLTTGDMMDGGPFGYLSRTRMVESTVLMVGYQADDTNGKSAAGADYRHQGNLEVHCEAEYDFSAHADHNQIVQFIGTAIRRGLHALETRELFLKDLGNYNVLLPKTVRSSSLTSEKELIAAFLAEDVRTGDITTNLPL